MKKPWATPVSLMIFLLTWSSSGLCRSPDVGLAYKLPSLEGKNATSSVPDKWQQGDSRHLARTLPSPHLWGLQSPALLGQVRPALASRRAGVHYLSRGLRLGGGISRKSDIQTYGLNPYVAFSLPAGVDNWFGQYGMKPSWLVEGWVAYLRDDKKPFKTDSFEIGFNPLILRLTFPHLGPVSPYLEGGEGVMYIDLRGQELGTRFQFANQVGAGVAIHLGASLNLELSYRYRHISNLGMASNPGINTQLGLAGVRYDLP